MSEDVARESPVKRALADSEEPEAKRPKGKDGEDGIGDVCAALSNIDFGTPWSPTLRELLLGLVPPALRVTKDSRGKNEENTIRMVAEVLDAELKRFKESVDAAQTGAVRAREAKASRKTAAEEHLEELKTTEKEVKDQLAELPKSFDAFRTAAAQWSQAAEHILSKEKTESTAALRDHFSVLKDGVSGDDVKHLQALKALLTKLNNDDSGLDQFRAVFRKPPAERNGLERGAVQQLEDNINKYVATLDAKMKFVMANGRDSTATPTTIAQVEEMVGRIKTDKLLTERSKILHAKADSLKALKEGTVTKTKRKIMTLVRLCKSGMAEKQLLTAIPPALQKKPAERDEADTATVRQVEELLDERIRALEEQLGEAALTADAERQQLEDILANVRRSADSERDAKEEALEQRKELDKIKMEKFEPLKTGSWGNDAKPKVPRHQINTLVKYFKDLDPSLAEYSDGFAMSLKILPKDRTEFQNNIVRQFEGEIDKRIQAIDDKVEAFEVSSQPQQAIDTWESLDAEEEKRDEAESTRNDCLLEVAAAERERQRVEQASQKKQQQVKASEEALAQAVEECDKTQASMFALQEARLSLNMLADIPLKERED